MLTIEISQNWQEEKQYALQVVFEQWLKVDYHIVLVDALQAQVSLKFNDKKITFPDLFFQTAQQDWLQQKTIPTRPSNWLLPAIFTNCSLDKNLPLLWGDSTLYEENEQLINLPFDLIGSVFFMLTRYEELCQPKLDKHGRFSASASHALQNNYLERPLIDEYVTIVASCIQRLFMITTEQDSFKQFVSCDVDAPYACGSKNIYKLGKQIAADALIRREPALCYQSVKNYLSARFNPNHKDTLDTFDWMMDCNEQANTSLAFYFIAEHTHPTLDGCYEIDEPVVVRHLHDIARRGHEIGLHGSYNSNVSSEQLLREKEQLQNVLQSKQIEQQVIGHRFHYLRWKTDTSARYLTDAGFEYDTSLGYADHIGFRCGTCREFRMYDIKKRQTLSLIQRPLIVMETSLFDLKYMNLPAAEDTINRVLNLKEICKKFQGNFTLLWHNSTFYGLAERSVYKTIIGV